MTSTVQILSRVRDSRYLTVTAMLAASALLWWMLLAMEHHGPMTAGWSMGLALSTAGMWVLMMLAMMLPAMAPVVSVYAGLAAKEETGAWLGLRIACFLAGYFALWAGVSVALALFQLGFRGGEWFTMDGTRATPLAAAVLLIAAGGYQFTPVKDACLHHCRSPLAFLIANWREGLRGAFPLGLRHGIYCVGCCVAIMGLMFVLGAMNPWWMAAISTFFVAEKLMPRAEDWTRTVGTVLIVAGLAVGAADLAGWDMP